MPAIGGPTHVRSPPSVGSLQEFLLPPPPVVPNPPAFPPFVKPYEVNPESLLPGVIENLTAVTHAWCINNTTPTSTTIDILGILQTTTRAIRAFRNYVLSLPDESAGTIRSQFRSKILGPGKSINLPSSSSPDPLTLIRKSALEVLTVLRELEENCRLPLSDDAYDDVGNPRGAEAMELLPDESDTGSIDQDPYLTYSLVQVEGRFESIPVWEDEEDSSFVFGDEDDGKEKREPWDERLVVGNGWLYRQDVKLEDLERERKVLLSYVDVVDEVLFGGSKEFAERGWEREKRKLKGRGGPRPKNRRVSAGDGEGRSLGVVSDGGRRRVSMGMVDLMEGMSLSEEPEQMDDIGEDVGEDESMDDDELPEWARKSTFIEDNLGRLFSSLPNFISLYRLGRAHSLLLSFLPSALQPALQPSSPREAFLESLSFGQLLCTAYNSCVRKSKKPWGYVSKDGIHDIIALEKSAEADLEGEASAALGKKSGWTFRRTDNLRLWAGLVWCFFPHALLAHVLFLPSAR